MRTRIQKFRAFNGMRAGLISDSKDPSNQYLRIEDNQGNYIGTVEGASIIRLAEAILNNAKEPRP